MPKPQTQTDILIGRRQIGVETELQVPFQPNPQIGPGRSMPAALPMARFQKAARLKVAAGPNHQAVVENLALHAGPGA